MMLRRRFLPLFLLLIPGHMQALEVIGHRGSAEGPENTLAAFKIGWSQTTMCELDIWPTSDGKLLVCHDHSTKRTTGVDELIDQHTLAELQQLDAGSKKGPQFAGEKLPSLAEVLAAIPPGKMLLVEIKSETDPAYEKSLIAVVVPELKREIEASGKIAQVKIHSFIYPALVAVKQALPSVPAFYLADTVRDEKTKIDPIPIPELIEQAKAAGLEGLNLQDSPVLDAAAAKKIHDAGLKLNVWTVDKPAAARRLRDLGVDGIISNHAGPIRAALGIPPATPAPQSASSSPAQ